MSRRRISSMTGIGRHLVTICLVLLIARGGPARGENETAGLTPAERGYHWLTTKAYLPADFDQEVFDNLWKVWPADWRTRAAGATPAERRAMAFSRYGLMERPGSDGTGPALGYVADEKGGWVMNCLACHTGKVEGRVIPGIPNSNYALETLTEEVRLTKLSMRKPLSHMDKGSLGMPLGTTRGTTNSVMFGVALGALRDKDLNVRRDVALPVMPHNDLDAAPYCNVRRKGRHHHEASAAKG